MARINEHYEKLQAGYLFPEVTRRVREFRNRRPEVADDVVNCGIGDVTEPLPPAVIDAMHGAVDELSQRTTFRGYGPASGDDFLRETIAQGDFTARGIAIDASEIFVSDGSKGDCGHVLEILGRGNRIAVPDPVYPVYVDTNVMAGHTGAHDGDGYDGLVYLPMTVENDFVPALPDERVDVIYLCYPNNPTGAMITREGLARWVEYALEVDAIILYDAAYMAFIRDDALPRSIYEIDGARRCAMEFHSFSKNGGFTGVRCGYTVCPTDLEGTLPDGSRRPLHPMWTRRWNTRSNGISYPVQRGAEALYSEAGQTQVQSLIDHYMTNADILREGCRRIGLDAHGGEHAPYVWVSCPDGIDSWTMFDRLLEDAHIVTTPGAGFGRCGEGFFRISAFNQRDRVETVVDRLASLSLQVT